MKGTLAGFGALTEEWDEKYWFSIRQHVHQLIAWGYEDAQVNIRPNLEEPDITGFLAEAMSERLRSFNGPKWCTQFVIKEDNPVAGLGRIGKRRKRPDLIIECTKRGRPEYVFEAKPLRTSKYPPSHYLGTNALQRFLRGDYASRYPEAGMLGYVQSQTVAEWAKKLRTTIEKDAKYQNLLCLEPSGNRMTRDVNINTALTSEWVSVHTRQTGERIRIFHILLNCCPRDAASVPFPSF